MKGAIAPFILILPLMEMLVACSDGSTATVEFVSAARTRALLPNSCQNAEVLDTEHAQSRNLKSGAQFTLKISTQCYEDWNAVLSRSGDWRCLEDFSAGMIVEHPLQYCSTNGFEMTLTGSVVVFRSRERAEFAWMVRA